MALVTVPRLVTTGAAVICHRGHSLALYTSLSAAALGFRNYTAFYTVRFITADVCDARPMSASMDHQGRLENI